MSDRTTSPGASIVEARATRSDRVEALLSRMTLREKAGQMTQLTLEAVSVDGGGALDEPRLHRALVDYHVGSVINVWDRALPPVAWHTLIRRLQRVATQETRLGIPILYGTDAVHGAGFVEGAVLFPHNLGLAAARDPVLVRRCAAVTAREIRACGIPWNFAPVLDVGRQPLWSRFVETFGEDVHLATIMGRAAIGGLQGDAEDGPSDRVAACAKHFVGYSAPVTGRDRTPVYLPEHVLRELFLPPFEAAVRAGVRTVMVNSGEVNGVPVHASHYLLTDVLRGELGFDGVIVSDWEDVIRLHTIHRVAEDEREAAFLAVQAGIDVSMTPRSLAFADHVVALAEEGRLSMERIDASVRRILRMKEELGLFGSPVADARRVGDVGQAEARRLGLEAARASIVLLENRHATLPLPKTARVLVTGPGAASVAALHGPWSGTWQGADETAYPGDALDIAEALRQRVGADRVSHVPGATYTTVMDVDAVVEATHAADVVVMCLGERPSVEKPGDIDDLTLAPAQRRLASAVMDTGTPVVLVLLTGRPRLLDGLAERAAAVVFAGYPGSQGAQALCDVLYGDVNPSGKLPFTYPRHSGAVIPYDHRRSDEAGRAFGVKPVDDMDGFDPQWPFGHGLSYTSFQYTDLVVEPAVVAPEDVVIVSVAVANTGERPGAEVVHVYVSDRFATLTPPVKRLRAFRKIPLEAGARERVVFELPVADWAFVGLDHQRRLEPGDFDVHVGPSTAHVLVEGRSSGHWAS